MNIAKAIVAQSVVDGLKWGAEGLVPAIAQDHATNEVLMLAYMNRESLTLTIETGEVHYYSRSRKSLWKKGESSGHIQLVRELRLDCDGDTVLVKVEQTGGIACHTGRRRCFFNRLEDGAWMLTAESDPVLLSPSAFAKDHQMHAENSKPRVDVLERLESTIASRQNSAAGTSYVASLNAKGLDTILKKIGEEATETIIAAKSGDREKIVYEMADLLFHSLVMLQHQNISFSEVLSELERREGTSGIDEKNARK